MALVRIRILNGMTIQMVYRHITSIFAQYGPSIKSTVFPPKKCRILFTKPSEYGVFLNRIINTRPTARVLVTYGRKKTV